jgi:hypothetical protein
VKRIFENPVRSLASASTAGIEDSGAKLVKQICLQARAIVSSKYYIKEDAELDIESLLKITPPEVQPLFREPTASATILLHRAFLHLTSKSLAHASPLTFPLARRAHRFGLYFHLPLYAQIITSSAIHSEFPVPLIVEFSNLACQSLQVALEPRFFSDPLIQLIKRNRFRDALDVLVAMRDRFDIHALPTDVAAKMLAHLKEQLKEELEFTKYPDDYDKASELAISLYGSLVEEMGERRESNLIEKLSKDLDSMIEALESILIQLQYDDEDLDDDSDGEDDVDHGVSNGGIKELLRLMRNHPAYSDDLFDALIESLYGDSRQDDNPFPIKFEAKSNSEGGGLEWYRQSDQHDHDEMVKKVVYLRDSTSWRLPDVTEQLTELNCGTEVLYSQEYEEKLIDELEAKE